MKKIIAAMLIATVAMTSVCARSKKDAKKTQKTVMHSVNLSFPFAFQSWNVDTKTSLLGKIEGDTNFAGVTFNWNMLTVYDNRFTMIWGGGIGYTKASLEEKFGDTDLDGIHLTGKFGAGFAPLNTEAMTLAFHGFMGINARPISGSANDVDYSVAPVGLALGADVFYVYRISPKFGLNVGLDLSFDIIGSGTYKIEAGNNKYEYDLGYTGFNLEPRIGACLII